MGLDFHSMSAFGAAKQRWRLGEAGLLRQRGAQRLSLHAAPLRLVYQSSSPPPPAI
jgi:hypothetical protein